MDRTRAQEQLVANWVTIVLAVISIIQGFAFNDLVVRFPPIYQHYRSTGDIQILAHYVLSFILLLRVFQTYLTAALDYNPWMPRLFDVLVIFIVGAIEYFIFSSLVVPAFDTFRFHRRFSLIALCALVGYLGALIRIKEDLFPAYSDYRREVRLQVRNIVGVAIVLAISVVIIATPDAHRGTQTLLATISALVLGVNTFNSLSVTFSAHRRDLPLDTDTPVSSHTSGPHADTRHVLIERPRREDAAELCELFIQHFGYIYTTIFDASVRLTYRIVKRILISGWGRHPFGYKAFHVARDRDSNELLGFLMVRTGDSYNFFTLAGATARAALITTMHLGVVGLVRTYRNLRKLELLIPASASDELHIMYVAVRPTARRHQVGSQLLEFAEHLAREQGLSVVTLEVREANPTAQQFFRAKGFSSTHSIQSPGDEIIGRGARIRMIRKVKP